MKKTKITSILSERELNKLRDKYGFEELEVHDIESFLFALRGAIKQTEQKYSSIKNNLIRLEKRLQWTITDVQTKKAIIESNGFVDF